MQAQKAGRYELLEEIGRGAMGVVFRGHDPLIGRTVAVKTLRLTEAGSGLTREEMLQRFQTEARAAGRVTHPNIVVVHDTGEDDGRYYITMEYVEGPSMQALLDRRQSFPLPRILPIFRQVCAALDFAHQRGVVHRDIKPANILLTKDEVPKITDFGTAKIMQLNLAQTAHVMGTPSYMSPEQVKGKPVDGRTDIFALGVVLYELLTGEKPFPGQNITTVIYKIVNEEPLPPSTHDSTIHPGLNVVIRKALAKDPAERFQTCIEFLHALENYRALDTSADATLPLGTPRPAVPSGPAVQPFVRRAQTTTESRPGTTDEIAVATEDDRPQARVGFILAFLLAVLAAVSYMAWPVFESILAYTKTTSNDHGAPGIKVDPSGVQQAGSGPSPMELLHTAKEPPTPAAKAARTPAPPVSARSFSASSGAAANPGGIAAQADIAGALATLYTSSKRRVSSCRTPCRFEGLNPGQYTLRISKNDFRPIQKTLDVAAGNVVEASYSLEALAATLVIRTSPPGAEILVNGRKHSQTTPATLDLSPAKYVIQVQSPGYQGYRGIFDLKDGENRELELELVKREK